MGGVGLPGLKGIEVSVDLRKNDPYIHVRYGCIVDVTNKPFLFSCVSGRTRPSRIGGARWTSRKQGSMFDYSLRASLDYLLL